MKFNAEKCGYCGACVSVCPNSSLELTENRIIINENKCDDCGRCSIICPLGAFYIIEVEEEINLMNFRKSPIHNTPKQSLQNSVSRSDIKDFESLEGPQKSKIFGGKK